MAGILANAVSATMTAPDTAVDQDVSGYLNQEQITLSTTPTGSAYAWSLSKPSGATSKSDLSASTGASVRFTPDQPGYYTVECTVDSTTVYVLRISVTDTVASTAREALRLMPKADAQIATPSTGEALFYSSTRSLLTKKDATGNEAHIAHPGDVGADLADTDETITLAQGAYRYLPAGTLSATRTKTLGTAGAAAGHILTIHKDDDGETLTVANDGGGGGTWDLTGKHFAAYRFDGTDWAPHERFDLS